MNLPFLVQSGRGLSSNYHLIYIAIMDITVLPYLVRILQRNTHITENFMAVCVLEVADIFK